MAANIWHGLKNTWPNKSSPLSFCLIPLYGCIYSFLVFPITDGSCILFSNTRMMRWLSLDIRNSSCLIIFCPARGFHLCISVMRRRESWSSSNKKKKKKFTLQKERKMGRSILLQGSTKKKISLNRLEALDAATLNFNCILTIDFFEIWLNGDWRFDHKCKMSLMPIMW